MLLLLFLVSFLLGLFLVDDKWKGSSFGKNILRQIFSKLGEFVRLTKLFEDCFNSAFIEFEIPL